MLYRQAITTRADCLGVPHEDTVVVMHNLAELYRAAGDTESAEQLQTAILSALKDHPDAQPDKQQ